MSDQFDVGRLLVLLRNELVARYRTALIIAGAIAAAMLVQALVFQPLESNRELAYMVVSGLIFYLLGPIVASRSFVELHDKKRNEAWLLLPASALEKVVARLLLVTVLFVPFGVVLVVLTSALISGVKTVLFSTPEVLFVPDGDLVGLDAMGRFFLHQSLFFLGAAWFRKAHFLKTAFSISVISIGLFWFFAIAAGIALPNPGAAWVGAELGPFLGQLGDSLGYLPWLGRLVGYVIVPVFCWTVVWLRVRETQVSYGI